MRVLKLNVQLQCMWGVLDVAFMKTQEGTRLKNKCVKCKLTYFTPGYETCGEGKVSVSSVARCA